MVNRSLLLKLRQLLDEFRNGPHSSMLELMWQIRTHECNQAVIPQAIFRVGGQLASVVYLEDLCCWEVQLDGDEHQFDTFQEAREFTESASKAIT